MAFCSPKRSAEQLIKSRNAALRLKNGSPKFRDVIRQRCRNKVKENRQKYIELLRNPSGSHDLNHTLSDTIQEEIMTLCHTIDSKMRNHSDFEIINGMYVDRELLFLQDDINESEKLGIEIDDAEVNQIMQSYDAIITHTLLDQDFIDIVECPICDNGTLVLTECEILCSNCDITITARTSLKEMQNKIQSHIITHSNLCLHKLSFVSVDNSLVIMCSQCSYNDSIIF